MSPVAVAAPLEEDPDPSPDSGPGPDPDPDHGPYPNPNARPPEALSLDAAFHLNPSPKMAVPSSLTLALILHATLLVCVTTLGLTQHPKPNSIPNRILS